MRKFALGLALAFFAGNAIAAPFCVVSSSGEQCYYYDYPSCQRAAANQRGACVAQTEDDQGSIHSPSVHQPQVRQSSEPPFCVVAGYGTQCYYYDAPSCQRAAQSARGACVVNPNR